MNRKQFIEKNGATCKNWTWSWSFINEKDKVIIFGAWDFKDTDQLALVLNKEWILSHKGRRQPGFSQAIQHINLIKEEGYQLQIFTLIADDSQSEKTEPAKIKKFVPELKERFLVELNGSYYAGDHSYAGSIPEEVQHPDKYPEGTSRTIAVNTYERNAAARKACIEHYGYSCAVCSFDFEKMYGDIGKNYIHVHHRIPLSEIREAYEVDPIKDLIPVCPNCHAMIHRTKKTLTIKELNDRIRTIEK